VPVKLARQLFEDREAVPWPDVNLPARCDGAVLMM
jgi:hypothetical protein